MQFVRKNHKLKAIMEKAEKMQKMKKENSVMISRLIDVANG